MNGGRSSVDRRPLHVLFDVGTIGNLDDDQLLKRFAVGHGEAAELAFAALVERHGPGVLRTCRAVLRDEHEAHDAFQATFLVLVRKARRLWVGDSLGPWLRQVAYRVAQCSRRTAARRRKHEQRYGELAPAPFSLSDTDPDGGLRRVIDEELARLPSCYREVVGLCDLEGYPLEAAAKLLGRPLGTVKSRLARGRARLRTRLLRRGVAPAVGLPGLLWIGETASASVPGRLADATVHAARHVVAGGTVPPAVGPLVEGTLRMMLMSKLKLALAALFAAGLGATGAVTVARQAGPASATTTADTRPDASAGAADAAALELDRLDLELLGDEVKQLRQQVADAFRARQRNGTTGTNDAYEALKSSYLAKSRELKREQRRLAGLDPEREADARPATENPPPPVKQPQAPPVTVGSVNVEKVLKGYAMAEQARNNLKVTVIHEEERLKDLQNELRKLVAELESHAPNDLKGKVLEESISQKKMLIEGARERAQAKIGREEAETLSVLHENIRRAIAEVAKAKNLTYVVAVSPNLAPGADVSEVQKSLGRPVLYADPRTDITEEVTRYLNMHSGEHPDPALRTS